MEMLNAMWEGILSFFGFVSNMGPSVVMAIVLFIMGVVLKAGVGKSLRAGLTVGVGFIGLNLVIGMMAGNLGPAVQEMSQRFGLSLSIIDVGWPAAAAIAFASKVGMVIIPVCLVVNIIMLLFNATQTIDIDIWDYWHFAFTGALVAILTGSEALGILAAVLNMVIVLVLADYTAPGMETYHNLPGVSLPHGFTTAFVPGAILINKILDFIPGINKIKMDMTTLQKRFGVIGEPILVGTVLGIAIAILSGKDFAGTLIFGVTMGAVLVLIPKMAAMLMEGLIPISDAAAGFISKNFQNRGKIYIGLDSAVGIGHPTALAMSLVLVPMAIFLAVILPGNRTLPFADLAVIPWMFVLIIPVVKDNGFRAFIVGIFTIAIGLYIATDLAPMITQAAINAKFPIPEGANQISSICDGANPLTWAIVRLHGLSIVGIGIVGVISIAMAVINRNRILKEAKALRESGAK
jgi:PTS system galactitol-specific IIC component